MVLAVAGCLVAPAVPASAQVSPTEARAAALTLAEARLAEARRAVEPVLADFEGRRINLAASWEQAQACMVLRDAQVECFRSVAALDSRVATLKSQKASSFTCGSPLRLYEHSFGGGRQLMFYSRGFWQNLTDYGFNDQMSSFSVGACPSYLAEHITGGGAFYPPGTLAAYLYVGWLDAGWDNRVSSIYLA